MFLRSFIFAILLYNRVKHEGYPEKCHVQLGPYQSTLFQMESMMSIINTQK